jgi:hypothetical protein
MAETCLLPYIGVEAWGSAPPAVTGYSVTIDTLAYTKTLEAAGVDRRAAEAHAEALVGHVPPDLVTKVDLDNAVHRIASTMHDQTVRHFGMTLGIVGLMNAILFALLPAVH